MVTKQAFMSGRFLISLDFELYWGIRDHRSVENYGANLRGVHKALPRMLELFDEYAISATFATVGFLFHEDSHAVLRDAPDLRPTYSHPVLDPYPDLHEENGNRRGLEYFAPELLELLLNHPRHEVATHTYSHFYCLEEGQTREQFRVDLQAAVRVAKSRGVEISSIVFPRNQLNSDYLPACRELGMIGYRGNEFAKLYAPVSGDRLSLLTRCLKFVDCYLNLSGHHCHSDFQMKGDGLVNLAASRFLRPYSSKLAILEGLKLHRIRSAMTFAARNGLTYHLWWHPHNFGINLEKNIRNLRRILEHFKALKARYDLRSCSMSQASKEILSG